VWERLAERSRALGQAIAESRFTDDPDVRLNVDGRVIRPVVADRLRCVFALPAGGGMVRLVSRSGHPTDARPWLDDGRRLGVYVRRIVWHTADGPQEMPVDHPEVGDGWWAVEHDGTVLYRWTNGDALLPCPVGARIVEVHLGGGIPYRADLGEARQEIAA
jgi:hypothetical protein